MSRPAWLEVRQGAAPLLVSIPHTGLDIPEPVAAALRSLALARRDADWWIERVYGFAAALDATVVRTTISRTVIDVNRDPSGVSLYPGQATTELCPTTTFDGEALYREGEAPGPAEIARRTATYFEPYQAALTAEVARLRALHPRVVVYDCHSIRSVIPRLFDGVLPECNIGTNSGTSCAPALTAAVEAICEGDGRHRVTDARFKGGFITRAFGRPAEGVHAIQMELACRTYMPEPLGAVGERDWPTPYDEAYASPMVATLRRVLEAALAFARNG